MKECITLRLPGEMKYLRLVSRFGARVAESMGQTRKANDSSVFSSTVELALSEAFTNSVKHKCLQQEVSDVIVTFEVGENQLTVIIKDSNPRFDMERIARPVPTDYPDSGYGLFLLKQIMDTVTYHRQANWNVVTMTKKTILN